ncbi:MAG: MarR family winged helix-turn-helix transcriptional regulator [Anaerolineae bacterium]|jgi:DNA-binding MarR family transcriptional regulator
MGETRQALAQEATGKFLTLYRYLRQYSRQRHAEGISGRKISTLRYLAEAGPRTVGQLSTYLCIGDSSTSALIDRLEERGYATRTRSRADHRVVLVDLTPEGREMAARTPLGGIPRLREALRALPEERLAVVCEAMTTLVEILEMEDEC